MVSYIVFLYKFLLNEILYYHSIQLCIHCYNFQPDVSGMPNQCQRDEYQGNKFYDYSAAKNSGYYFAEKLKIYKKIKYLKLFNLLKCLLMGLLHKGIPGMDLN